MSVFKLLLDLLYIFGTSVQYRYLGRYIIFNSVKYLMGWIVFIVFVFLLQFIKDSHIKFMVNILFILSGVSNISLYGLRDYDTCFFLLVVVFWFFIVLAAAIITSTVKYTRPTIVKPLKIDICDQKVDFLLAVAVLLTLYLFYKYGKIDKMFLTNLYLIRSEFRQLSISSIDNYLLSWNAVVILPWCFLVYISSNKKVHALFCLLLAYLMFSINGMKTWLFIYVIMFGMFFLSRKLDLRNVFRVIVLFSSLSMVIALLLIIFYSYFLPAGLLDRIFILPGEVNYYYLDFFENHEFLFLRESIMRFLAQSPYNPKSPIQISQLYMSAAFYHNATNGMLGDMYANFGVLGLFIYPWLIISSLKFLKAQLEKFDIQISSPIYFILMWLLTNTSFFTWLMTGGYLLYIIIAFAYKRVKAHSKQSSAMSDR